MARESRDALALTGLKSETEFETRLRVNELLEGKINSLGDVTLTANATTTTLTDKRIGPQSVIVLMPTTANAAGAWATTYVSARTKGSATITHANAATTDRTFAYACFG